MIESSEVLFLFLVPLTWCPWPRRLTRQPRGGRNQCKIIKELDRKVVEFSIKQGIT
jgi:hypothetical protein